MNDAVPKDRVLMVADALCRPKEGGRKRAVGSLSGIDKLERQT